MNECKTYGDQTVTYTRTITNQTKIQIYGPTYFFKVIN